MHRMSRINIPTQFQKTGIGNRLSTLSSSSAHWVLRQRRIDAGVVFIASIKINTKNRTQTSVHSLFSHFYFNLLFIYLCLRFLFSFFPSSSLRSPLCRLSDSKRIHGCVCFGSRSPVHFYWWVSSSLSFPTFYLLSLLLRLSLPLHEEHGEWWSLCTWGAWRSCRRFSLHEGMNCAATPPPRIPVLLCDYHCDADDIIPFNRTYHVDQYSRLPSCWHQRLSSRLSSIFDFSLKSNINAGVNGWNVWDCECMPAWCRCSIGAAFPIKFWSKRKFMGK